MKTIAVLTAIMLLGIVSAQSQDASLMDRPDMLKIGIIGPYGEYMMISAMMGDDGKWTVLYTDNVYNNPTMHFGNETGWVQIT